MRDIPRAKRGIPRAKTGIALQAAVWAMAALSGTAVSAASVGTPLLGQAGAALVPGADAAAAVKGGLPQGAQKMADNFNKAGTADAATPADGPAPAAGGGSFDSTTLARTLMKYAPSYVMMALAISLGLFVVCRPAGFSLASLVQEKKPKP